MKKLYRVFIFLLIICYFWLCWWGIFAQENPVQSSLKGFLSTTEWKVVIQKEWKVVIQKANEIVNKQQEQQQKANEIANKQQEQQQKQECPNWCCWIKLNTNFPIIWNCIETKKDASTNPTNAFPMMMWVITQIVVSLILVVCFILIIVAWVKRASDDPKWWKELLQKVAITVILLWLTWVILKAINPVFFS